MHEHTQILNMAIGKKIRTLRKDNNITTTELGSLVGISQQQISRYERGVNQIPVHILVQLSFIFKIPIADFLNVKK